MEKKEIKTLVKNLLTYNPEIDLEIANKFLALPGFKEELEKLGYKSVVYFNEKKSLSSKKFKDALEVLGYKEIVYSEAIKSNMEKLEELALKPEFKTALENLGYKQMVYSKLLENQEKSSESLDFNGVMYKAVFKTFIYSTFLENELEKTKVKQKTK